jgi:glucosamine kinase
MADQPSTDATVLCMDAGQTTTRSQCRRNGEVLGETELPGVLTDRPLLPQLASAIRSGLNAADTPVQTASVGVSGLVDNADASELLDMLAGTGISEVLLAHDSTTSYLSAIGDEPGAVVAAGTGAVTLAVGTTRTARVDGWGYLMGDAGSGFWIGREALDRVMQAHDGRGAPTALTAIIQRDFDDLEEAYLELQADELRVSRIAAYAATVAELAETDLICSRISEQAAARLVHSVAAGLRLVHQAEREDPAVGAVGNVFANPVLRSRFERLLRDQYPALRLIEGRGDGLEGCFRMTLVGPDSALRQRISRAVPSTREQD